MNRRLLTDAQINEIIDGINEKNQKRHCNAFYDIIDKYETRAKYIKSDVIDLLTLQIVEDNGSCRNATIKPFGSNLDSKYFMPTEDREVLEDIVYSLKDKRSRARCELQGTLPSDNAEKWSLLYSDFSKESCKSFYKRNSKKEKYKKNIKTGRNTKELKNRCGSVLTKLNSKEDDSKSSNDYFCKRMADNKRKTNVLIPKRYPKNKNRNMENNEIGCLQTKLNNPEIAYSKQSSEINLRDMKNRTLKKNHEINIDSQNLPPVDPIFIDEHEQSKVISPRKIEINNYGKNSSYLTDEIKNSDAPFLGQGKCRNQTSIFRPSASFTSPTHKNLSNFPKNSNITISDFKKSERVEELLNLMNKVCSSLEPIKKRTEFNRTGSLATSGFKYSNSRKENFCDNEPVNDKSIDSGINSDHSSVNSSKYSAHKNCMQEADDFDKYLLCFDPIKDDIL